MNPSDVNEGINQARCPCNGPGCPDCNIEVAPQGVAGFSGGVEGHALESGRAALPMRCGEGHFHSRHKNSRLRECPEQQVSVSSENQASPAESQLYSLAVFLGGLDAMIQQVEGVLLRHRVTETGLVEVGQ